MDGETVRFRFFTEKLRTLIDRYLSPPTGVTSSLSGTCTDKQSVENTEKSLCCLFSSETVVWNKMYESIDYNIFDIYLLCFCFTENRPLLPAHLQSNRRSDAYLPVFDVDVVTISKKWVKRPASPKPPNNFSPVGVYKLGKWSQTSLYTEDWKWGTKTSRSTILLDLCWEDLTCSKSGFKGKKSSRYLGALNAGILSYITTRVFYKVCFFSWSSLHSLNSNCEIYEIPVGSKSFVCFYL